MEAIAIIISLVILIVLIKLLSPVKSKDLADRSRIQIETELELARIELIEARNNITLIEHRRRSYPYSNLPKRYYDYLRKVEYLPAKIQVLEKELRECSTSSTLFFSPKDKQYLNSQLSSFRTVLNNLKEQLDEMKFHFEGKGTPKGWYEAKEVFDLYESKINFIIGKISELEKNRHPFHNNPFNQNTLDIT
jgi:hypothetical protein